MEKKMDTNAQQMKNEMNENACRMENKMDSLNKKMDGNALEAKNKMKNEMKEMRGEMQRIGRSLQAGTVGIMAIARSETRTTEHIMVVPRAGANRRGRVWIVAAPRWRTK